MGRAQSPPTQRSIQGRSPSIFRGTMWPTPVDGREASAEFDVGLRAAGDGLPLFAPGNEIRGWGRFARG